MKLRKRFLAALVAVAMLLTMVPFGAVFADETADTTAATVELKDIDANTTVGKAVGELVKLGIINGYEDGTFRADNTITRGEVAKIIIAFMGQESVAFDTVPSGFADVDEPNHWAKKYIKLAADQKIVNGYVDGTFRPDDPVKYTEIVKMLVCTLGYGSIAEDRTAAGSLWYSGYMAVAAEKGILKSATVNNVEDYASRGTVATLTFNCLDVSTAETDSSGETIINNDSTALDKFQGKEKITGVVTGVQQTGIYTGATGLLARQITVEIKGKTVTYEVPAKFDTMSILGRKISGYVEDGDLGGNDKITQIAVEKTESTIITPDMMDRVEGSSISYYASATSTRSKSIGVGDVKVIYNGKYDPTFKPSDFEDVRSGQIELICNDSDGDAEVAFVTSYQNYVVNSVDKSQKQPKVYAKYGAGELVIPIDVSGAYFSLTKTGSTSEPETIAKSLSEWDVISVMKSKDDAEGKIVWNGIVTSKKVSGKVTEADSDTRKKIGNQFYDYAYNFIDYEGSKPAMAVGDYVTIYLDADGKIAAATSSQTEANIYLAYLITADKKDGVDGATRVNLYGITGTTKQRILNLADTVRIDGHSVKVADALTTLKTAAAKANIGKAEKGINVTPYSQLIRYTTNAKNEVDMIDTVMENKSVGEDDLKVSFAYPLEGEAEKVLKYSAGQFKDGSSLKFIADSSTKILEIPIANVAEVDDYKIRAASAAFIQGKEYRVEAYNVGSTFTAKYVLSFVGGDYGLATINEKSPMMLVSEVSTATEGEEIVDRVKGSKFPSGEEVSANSESGILMGKLLLGDIFRYAESDNKVVAIEKVLEFNSPTRAKKPAIYYLDPENKKPELKGKDVTLPITLEEAAASADQAIKQRLFKIDNDTTRGETGTVGGFMFGTALSYLDGKLVVTPTTVDDTTGIQQMHQKIFNVGSAKVYVYDYTTTRDAAKVLADSTIDTVGTYEKVTNAASQVMVYYTGAYNAKAIVVFKY